MNDKYGERDPWNAICSRGDLVEDGTASPNGCYDTKATHFAGLSKNKLFFNLKRFKNLYKDYIAYVTFTQPIYFQLQKIWKRGR